MVTLPDIIRIGTRRSNLALAQAAEVKHRLLAAFPALSEAHIAVVAMDTTGDRIQNRHLADIGGKGLFTKEIEEALADGRVDIAVHSMKDMPDTLPSGMDIPCILEREDPRDAFLSLKAASLAELPKGAVLGTASIRRQAQVLHLRPDLTIVPFRGNVNTRLEKLAAGEVDATLLAVAGLKRLNLASAITEELEPERMLPAVAQGAIGVECRAENAQVRHMLSAINHAESFTCVAAERGFLKALGGSCTTPIAGLAELSQGKLHFRGLVAAPDGTAFYRIERTGSPEDAEKLGVDAGMEALKNAKALLGR